MYITLHTSLLMVWKNKDQCECPVLSTREDLTFISAILALLAGSWECPAGEIAECY